MSPIGRDAADDPEAPVIGVAVAPDFLLVGLSKARRTSARRPELIVEAVEDLLRNGAPEPGLVLVRDETLVQAVRQMVSSRGWIVEHRAALPELDSVVRKLRHHADLQRPEIPSALAASDVTSEDLRSFAEAAQRFLDAAPWRRIDGDADIIVVDSPRPDPATRAVSVMGAAGQQYGFVLLEDPDDFAVWAEPDNEDYSREHATWSVSWWHDRDVPAAEQALWRELGLPAPPGGIPLAVCYGPKGRVRRASPRLLAFFSGLFDAVATTTDEELDSGRWSKTVSTRLGKQTYNLKLPSVLAIDKPPERVGSRSRLEMERTHRQIARLLKSQSFANLDEANAFLQRAVVGRKVDEMEPSSPSEEAQELAFRALDAEGRAGSILARRALALDPSCSDAFVALGHAAADRKERLAWLEKAVAAAERGLGAEAFESGKRSFWLDHETRPYMRARYELMYVLWDEGRRVEAVEHMRALVKLNPDDNQGVRFILVPALICVGELDEAESVLRHYRETGSAWYRYDQALLHFARKGDDRTARRALDEAIKVNPWVPALLLGEGDPVDAPYYTIGSPEEAALYLDGAEDAWDEVDGALEWLEQRVSGARRPRKPKPARGLKLVPPAIH